MTDADRLGGQLGTVTATLRKPYRHIATGQAQASGTVAGGTLVAATACDGVGDQGPGGVHPDKVASPAVPDTDRRDTYLALMDRSDEAGRPRKQADRDSLRHSVRHPYITRQHPAGGDVGSEGKDAPSAHESGTAEESGSQESLERDACEGGV